MVLFSSPSLPTQNHHSRYWLQLDLKNRSGADIFETLFGLSAIATLLESPDQVNGAPKELIRYSLCAGAPRRINHQTQLFTPPIGTILPTLDQLLRSAPDQITSLSSVTPPNHLPFIGGWLGWLGFDTAWEIENLPYVNQDPLPFPVAYWYEPEQFAVLDHHHQVLWLAALTPQGLEAMVQQLTHNHPHPVAAQSSHQAQSVALCSNQHQFEAAVQTAKEHIYAGDVFQVNLSLRFQTQTHQSPWQLYRQLHQINPSPFASYWRTPWGHIISCSPERLVHLQNQTAQTRPIAGTRPRGKTLAMDQALAQVLQANRKEQAEHIMLVDLERNDLGRVCAWGSIHINELMIIERYSHVMHLVSNVIGTLQSGYNAIDLIRATFPGGTITGCPKVRCMEIIEDLEPLRRNLFYGSCGYLDIRGNLDLNILIRTLLLSSIGTQQHAVCGQVGAGIVADSDPHQEWLESLQKAQAQLLALGASLPYLRTNKQ